MVVYTYVLHVRIHVCTYVCEDKRTTQRYYSTRIAHLSQKAIYGTMRWLMAAFTQSVHAFRCFCIHASCIRPYLLKALYSHVGLVQFILKLSHFVLQLTFEAFQRRHLAVGRGRREGQEKAGVKHDAAFVHIL